MMSAAETIECINDAWRTGRVEDLRRLFDADMVIVGPGYEVVGRGADACVASYRDFLRASVVYDYRQSSVSIHESGPVAIATYGWEMEYEQAGRRSRDRGTDLFVLRQEDGLWRAVWRAVTFEPAEVERTSESAAAAGPTAQ
jgi:ketosteroid isomerase-like protein